MRTALLCLLAFGIALYWIGSIRERRAHVRLVKSGRLHDALCCGFMPGEAMQVFGAVLFGVTLLVSLVMPIFVFWFSR